VVAALTVSTVVGEVESAAPRLCKGRGGIINNNRRNQEETYDVEETASAPFEKVEGRGAALIVMIERHPPFTAK
jgi:hypothetical protein